MIIPVRCFTCGKILADKWRSYQRRVKEMKEKGELADDDDIEHDVVKISTKEPRGIILDELGIVRMCCRRHMLSHVDLIDVI